MPRLTGRKDQSAFLFVQAKPNGEEVKKPMLSLEATLDPEWPMPEARLLSTAAAAHYLGVGEQTLRTMVHTGDIAFIDGKYWRFDRRELDRWIDANLTTRFA